MRGYLVKDGVSLLFLGGSVLEGCVCCLGVDLVVW